MTKTAHILFSGPMVQALLAGTKTQTRRTREPRWAAGDLLVVRETFRPVREGFEYRADFPADHTLHPGDKWTPSIHMPTKASRLTLRVLATRLEPLLDISEADAMAEGITRERVIIDMKCYGGTPVEEYADRFYFPDCPPEGFESAVEAYLALWDQINGEGHSAGNPGAWVTSFEVIRSNVAEVSR